ncbi:MAG: peptide MFS transporter [Flavobacteriales bacterium]|nr:peptide MFS transporter [Flavobacteriales bacterium]HQV76679.1 peptide MFS transporter [Flavobacteriales bacterium]HQW40545.1 peptide MFS transporter [Flavobacteriales bacterium]
MTGTTQTLQEIRDFQGKYPRQLWSLFFTEMWERFCFYGMRGMLVVFMVSQMGLDDPTANLQYGAIQAFVYAFTFIGGVFADKILGFRKSLLWGALLMIAGGAVIAFSPTSLFYIGTCFFIIGTGFFKPNISTMVGALYHTDDSRRDAGFSLFYAGINLGALLGGVIMVYVGKYHSWAIAFGLVSVVMTISLLNFLLTQKSLGPIGLSPMHPDIPANRRRGYEIATYIGSLIAVPFILMLVTNTRYTDLFMYIIGPATLVYLGWEMRKFNMQENKRLMAALVFIFFSILFWAFFEQSGGSLSLFALNNLQHSVLGIPMDPNVVNNSSNSLFVIIFAPIIGLLWVWLSKRKLEPNSVVKFGLGFLLLGAAFYVFYSTIFFADADGVTSLDVFTFGYFVITFGELCLSPIGLSLMTKLSPQSVQGLMMGMWFLASAYGQYVAGLLGAGMSSADPNATNTEKLVSYTDGYAQLGLYALVAGVVLVAISPFVRRLMKGVH